MFWLYIIIWLIFQIVDIMVPKSIQYIISAIETKSSEQIMLKYVLISLGIWMLAILLTYIFEIVWNKIRNKLYNEKHKLYKEKLLKMDYATILDNGTGAIISKITSWVSAEATIFVSTMQIILNTFIRGFIILIILFFYVPIFAVFMLIWFGIVYLINHFIQKIMDKWGEISNELEEQTVRSLSRIVMENLLIKIYNKKQFEINKAKYLHNKLYKFDTKINRLNFSIFQILNVLFKLIEMWIYFFIGLKVIRWEMSMSDFIMISAYYLRWMWWPISTAIMESNKINNSISKYKRLQEFFNTPNKIINWNQQYNYKVGDINIENIVFWYDENIVFDNFSLQIQWWKITALVWYSGSGKSTLVKLLLRIYDLKSWIIKYDNQNIKDIDINSLYKNIWYLSQEPAVFDGSIKENLLYSIDDGARVLEEDLFDCLKKVWLYEKVIWLKQWLNSQIWEKWLKLSWWEKQRLAIARIFLRNPSILILDEPTSSLDSISESNITSVLQQIMINKTVIIIAHRLQTVIWADKIIVLNSWKIEQIWNHNELLSQKWVYSKLVGLQKGLILN